ncbi:MAG: hypothetical protein JKX93_12235 [Rhizobiaceae bacterium]|nr:hypothetical protein [Rhizobiaceae bacterium]
MVNQTDAVFGNVKFEILPLALVFLTPFLVVSISQMFGVREVHKLTAQEALGGFLGTLFPRDTHSRNHFGTDDWSHKYHNRGRGKLSSEV